MVAAIKQLYLIRYATANHVIVTMTSLSFKWLQWSLIVPNSSINLLISEHLVQCPTIFMTFYCIIYNTNNLLGGFYGLPFQLLGDTPVRYVSQLTWGYPVCTLCQQLFDSYGSERYHWKRGVSERWQAEPGNGWHTWYNAHVVHNWHGLYQTYDYL